MDELELVRLHEDGEHLVLGGAGGARFVLPISESLRAAVRRDRPHLEHLRAEGERRLTPREIQSRLRAGERVEDVARAAGLAVEQVRRFAGPVLAEQEYVVERVRATRPGPDDDGPTVDELAEQRLRARDVDLTAIEWSAARRPGSPWVVTVEFIVASGLCTARWSFDAATRTLQPLDDEARWITQPEPPEEPVLAAAPEVFDVDAAVARRHASRRAPEPDGTADLLDDLGRRRGVRPRTTTDGAPAVPALAGQEPFEGFGPLAMLDGDGDRDGTPDGADEDDRPRGGATVVHLPAVRPVDRMQEDADLPHPAATRADDDEDGGPPARPVRAPTPSPRPAAREPEAEAEQEPAGVPADASPAPRAAPRETRRSRSRSRAKVPSWDEIVFGARPEH